MKVGLFMIVETKEGPAVYYKEVELEREVR